eukprot:scaffold1556_cov278-Prasinococcus_capsulatus_cf.AAC.2
MEPKLYLVSSPELPTMAHRPYNVAEPVNAAQHPGSAPHERNRKATCSEGTRAAHDGCARTLAARWCWLSKMSPSKRAVMSSGSARGVRQPGPVYSAAHLRQTQASAASTYCAGELLRVLAPTDGASYGTHLQVPRGPQTPWALQPNQQRASSSSRSGCRPAFCISC